MDFDDQVPILIRHVFEADIPQNTGVVKEHIYPAKCLDSGVYYPIAILDAVIIRDSFASSSSYVIDNYVRCL